MEIIVNPYNYNKKMVLAESIDLVNHFCKVNDLEVPLVIIDESIASTGLYECKRYHEDGISRIYIDFSRCRYPVKKPGFSWSFTGYKSDKTITGVIAHELGHHVHFSRDIRQFIDEFNRLKIETDEDYLTSYHPNVGEDIAESLRLFILNPDLLKKLRPKRYNKLLELGIKPITNLSWREILKYAPKELIRQCEKNS